MFQGTVFGPTLWNVYVSDLTAVISHLDFEIGLYADDINIFRTFRNDVSDVAIFEELKE